MSCDISLCLVNKCFLLQFGRHESSMNGTTECFCHHIFAFLCTLTRLKTVRYMHTTLPPQ
jgi:hypothetical protein